MFFSFDGVDGAGKTTQIALFCDWLEQQGHAVVTCRDPGSTGLGEALRNILLGKASWSIHRRAEMLIYMAARAQLVEEIIRPALQEGKVVVSDRYLLANIVYQGHAGGLDVNELWSVGRLATGGLEPRLTFLLDMDPAQSALRRQRDPDRMESQGLEYLRQVRSGYLTEAQRAPHPILVLDAARSIEAIQADLRQAAAEVLGEAHS